MPSLQARVESRKTGVQEDGAICAKDGVLINKHINTNRDNVNFFINIFELIAPGYSKMIMTAPASP